jgi:hypothetical protein
VTIKLKTDRVYVSWDDGRCEAAHVLWVTPSSMQKGLLNVGLCTESQNPFIVSLDGDGRDKSKKLVVTPR